MSIARAILANPRILILDEATSSLDSESEQMIQDGLRRLRSGRTTFVIAHRLSTIRSADQILVLEAGEIVERGTHAELLALDGRYRQLYDKQYKFEADRFINPGEDFTPEPEKPAAPLPRREESVAMDESMLLNGVLSSVLGGRAHSGRRPRAAMTYLTGGGGGSFWSNPTTLLTAAGVAWGIFETMQQSGALGSRFRRCGAVRRSGFRGFAGSVPPLPDVGRRQPVSPRGAAAGAAGDLRGERRRQRERHGARGDPANRRRPRASPRSSSAELQQPRPLAEIVAGVSDPAQRATLYVLAFSMVRADEQVTGAERIYLAQLAQPARPRSRRRCSSSKTNGGETHRRASAQAGYGWWLSG